MIETMETFALELAVERGHEETVRLLVGVRVNVDGSNGREARF